MFDKMFDFNGMFGKLGAGMCRLSAKGNIAVKTSGGYKTYNVKTGKLVNCSMFCFDLGDEMFFSIPTNKVNVGDIILVNGRPRCVIKVEANIITVLNYENNTIESMVPERHIFMGNAYFYGRVVSPLAGMFGKGSEGMKSLLQFMMMSKMLGAGGSGDMGGSQFGNLMMLSMMGGGNNMFSNMLNGMFDEMALPALDDDDKPAADPEEEKKPEDEEE